MGPINFSGRKNGRNDVVIHRACRLVRMRDATRMASMIHRVFFGTGMP